MPQIAKTSVGLRFSDKNSEIPLVPADLTSALGRPPTEAQTKGEAMTRRGKIIGASSGTPIIAQFSSWHYSVEDRKPGDLDGQIRELFGALTNDLSVWRSLAAKYDPDLFVGLFMAEENEGAGISADCLAILSERRVRLDFDIYER